MHTGNPPRSTANTCCRHSAWKRNDRWHSQNRCISVPLRLPRYADWMKVPLALISSVRIAGSNYAPKCTKKPMLVYCHAGAVHVMKGLQSMWKHETTASHKHVKDIEYRAESQTTSVNLIYDVAIRKECTQTNNERKDWQMKTIRSRRPPTGKGIVLHIADDCYHATKWGVAAWRVK